MIRSICSCSMVLFLVAGINSATAAELMKAEVKDWNRAPTFFFNDQPTELLSAGFMYPLYKYGGHTTIEPQDLEKDIWAFARTGIHGHIEFPRLDEMWKSPEVCDFGYFDVFFEKLVKTDPQAIIFINFQLNFPMWWLKKHPDQMVVWGDKIRFDVDTSNNGCSLHSSIWRQAATEKLREYIRYLKTTSYCHRIAGMRMGCSADGWQFSYWSRVGGPERGDPDYNKLAEKAFLCFLKDKYKTDAALQKAWNDTAVTFETASIPSLQERAGMPSTLYNSPDYEMKYKNGLLLKSVYYQQKLFDYAYFCAETMTELSAYFKKVLDEEVGGQSSLWVPNVRVGGMSDGLKGDELGNAIFNRNNLRKGWLRTSDTMFDYCTRSIGARNEYGYLGDSFIRQATGTARLNNIKPFIQEDSRTLMILYEEPEHPERWMTRHGHTSDTLPKALSLLRRNLGTAIINNASLYYFIPGLGRWHSDPALLGPLSRLYAYQKARLYWKREYVSEVALITDPESFLYVDARVDYGRGARDISQHFAYMGAPFELYQTDDLSNPKFPPHKLYVFLNMFKITPQLQKTIHDRLKLDNATALWLYAPGVYNETDFSLDSSKALTGIGLEAEMIRTKEKVTIQKTGHAFTEINGYVSCQSEVGPLFSAVADNKTEVIGQYSNGKPGFAAKKMDGWKSIYFGLTEIDTPILRAIARDAGVHLYDNNEDLNFYTDGWLYNLHSGRDQTVELKLPKPVDVIYDLYGDRVLATEQASVQVPIKCAETVQLFAGARGEYEQLKKLLANTPPDYSYPLKSDLSIIFSDPVKENGIQLVETLGAYVHRAAVAGYPCVTTMRSKGDRDILLRVDASKLRGKPPYNLELVVEYYSSEMNSFGEATDPYDYIRVEYGKKVLPNAPVQKRFFVANDKYHLTSAPAGWTYQVFPLEDAVFDRRFPGSADIRIRHWGRMDSRPIKAVLIRQLDKEENLKGCISYYI